MIVYMPIEHVDMRYTKHLDRDVLKHLERNQIKYKYMKPKVLREGVIKHGSFLDSDNTVYRQFSQMNDLIKGLLTEEIPSDATIFVSDLWNFGILSIPYLNYFGYYDLKVRGVLHAGSFTDTDFVRQLERYYKNFEDILFDISEEIYVGSHFMKEDLLRKRRIEKEKVIVTGLPLDFEGMEPYKKEQEKENIVIFNGRNVQEKQPHLFEKLSEELPQYRFANTQAMKLNKEEYYRLLSRSKVVVSFALQENFGYGVQEAVNLGCVPVLPNRLAYAEQFNEKYLYDTFDECVEKVKTFIEGDEKAPPPVISENKKIFNRWFK